MKLGFMELLDTSGLPEESKKFFEAMDEKWELLSRSK